MLYTDLQYYLNDRLVKTLDKFIDRCTREKGRRDVFLFFEGGEGEGKTNASIASGYYVKYKTKRDLHLFFGVKKAIELAKNNYNKIIIVDEPALDMLKKDWYTKTSMDLARLIMTARKRRHFIIFNMTKFHKFDEYLTSERGSGMIHVYADKNERMGRFKYIPGRKIEKLWRYWRKYKAKGYSKYSIYKGTFPEVMQDHFNKMGILIDGKIATLQDYENEKDRGIESIGVKEEEEKDNKYQKELRELKRKIATLPLPIKSRAEMMGLLGYHRNTGTNWNHYSINQPLENK